MSQFAFNSSAPRVVKAKFRARVPVGVVTFAPVVAAIALMIGAILLVRGNHVGLSVMGIAVIIATAFMWIHWDVMQLPAAPFAQNTQVDAIVPQAMLVWYRPTLAAVELWQRAANSDDGRFVLVRYGLDGTAITQSVPALSHDEIFTESTRIATSLGLPILTMGVILDAIIHLTPAAGGLVTQSKLQLADIDEGVHWAARLDHYIAMHRPIYGGLARDWASGYTPTLSRFGDNLSSDVEFAGTALQTKERTSQLDALVTDLNASNASVVIVGEPGIGKTALLLGLADRLLQGVQAGSLKHYQIYSLSAATILSNTSGQGDLERVVADLFTEAHHAANIIIALDEAQLFFGSGPGAVNLSQILLPVLQSRSLKLILALTPGDWQKLRATNPAMAGMLTPLVLSEPAQAEVMRILADRAVLFEQGHLITTYPALLEAYRLSGRYLQEEAYPGKAIKLLEAAYNHPDGVFVTAISVEQAVESQFGVKVQQATADETDVLLHLEDKIHQRMINQTRAVSVVANALRRARAGVANPRRPIGSFLFLGPTGVGKTELAKSIAALYFGAEANVIRLDMSEYQQVTDVDRILASAAGNSGGLLAKIRQAPFSVVLFDEVEKAHPNILNLFLQLLDEGSLTDVDGKSASFKDAIIIATSNAGADEIRARIEAGQSLESFEQEFTNSLISSGTFKPELLNRFDEIVLFRPLNKSELAQVVQLMVKEVNKTVANQNITISLADDAIAGLVEEGYDPRLGARPMRRMVTRRIEDNVAHKILSGELKPGDHLELSAADLAPETASASS